MSTPQQRHDRRREHRKRNAAATAAPAMNPVAEAIRRGNPDAVLPGEPRHKSPVERAVGLLRSLNVNDEDREIVQACANLTEYHRQQQETLREQTQRADLAERALGSFMESVALTLDLDVDQDGDTILATLRDRLYKVGEECEPQIIDGEALPVYPDDDDDDEETPEPDQIAVPPALHEVCKALARHFADDLAVTPSNAAGLVDLLANNLDDARREIEDRAEDAEKLRATLRQEQERGQQVGEQQIPVSALHSLVMEFGGSLDVHPVASLRQILAQLQANQKPEKFDENLATVVNSMQRYEAVLATIKNAISLA